MVTSEPTLAPSWSAMSLPSRMGGNDAVMLAESALGSSLSLDGGVGAVVESLKRVGGAVLH